MTSLVLAAEEGSPLQCVIRLEYFIVVGNFVKEVRHLSLCLSKASSAFWIENLRCVYSRHLSFLPLPSEIGSHIALQSYHTRSYYGMICHGTFFCINHVSSISRATEPPIQFPTESFLKTVNLFPSEWNLQRSHHRSRRSAAVPMAVWRLRRIATWHGFITT